MIELSAIYYDGKSSTGSPVTVRFEAGGGVQLEGLAAPLVFAPRLVRISPRVANTVRSLRFPGGASCETPDNEGVDAIEHAMGRGRLSRLVHRLEASWAYALIAAGFVILVVALGFRLVIPELAQEVAENVPVEVAYQLGEGTLATLDETLFSPSQLAEQRQQALQEQFEGLASTYPELPLELQFRHAPFPNAFALPDGTVVLTDALVELAERDEQILAVLAHEVGHVQHRHALRMALESSSVAILASAVLGDATQVIAIASALPAVYANAHYSRGHEVEADTFAMQFLDENGIGRHHFADMLQRLEQHAGGDRDSSLDYLSSHPPTPDRVQRFRN